MSVFQIFREDGRLQFDASLMTFALLSKGTIATGPRLATNTSSSTAKVPIPIGVTRYLIATRAGVPLARSGIYADGNGDRFELFQSDAFPGTPLDYFIFVRTAEFPSRGWGFEMFAPDGRCTFSMHLETMRIAGLISGLGSSVQLPAGRTYAAIQPYVAGEEYETDIVRSEGGGPIIDNPNDPSGSGPSTQWYRQMHGKLHGIGWSGTTATIAEVSFDDVWAQTNYGPDPDPPRDFWHVFIENAMLVDVTGL